MNKTKLGDYRRRLKDERMRLMEAIQHKRVAVGEIRIEHTEDEADLAIISHDRELLFNLSQSDSVWLNSIREAMERIDSNRFGECLNCQEDIHESRLAAAPWVALCLRCQEQEEMDRASAADVASIADQDAPEF